METSRFVGREFVIFVISLAMVIAACSKDEETSPTSPEGPVDHSGTYNVTLGAQPCWTMDLEQNDGGAVFTITDGKLRTINGTGYFRGDSLYLCASVPGFIDTFYAGVLFAQDGNDFSGFWHLETNGTPMYGSITGSKSAWTTYDIDLNGIPRFAVSDCIELDKIQRISKFRSGEGHDYSDDFESCRSMKHYYVTKDGVDMQSVKLYAPVTGTITGRVDEYDGSLWKGTQIGIKPIGYEAFTVIIFHIDLNDSLAVGDTVYAGDELGSSEKNSGTVTDIAVAVHVPQGYKLISYFEVMTDGLFALYRARGVGSRDEMIITKEERDADPLTCTGEQFEDTGNLENWVELN